MARADTTHRPVDAPRLIWLERLMGDVARAQEASLEVRRLMDLSDEALAARGLTRESIVDHVFKRYPPA